MRLLLTLAEIARVVIAFATIFALGFCAGAAVTAAILG